MPVPLVAAGIVAVQIAIRYIVIAAIQLGIWSLIEKYALPAINNAIISIMQTFGVSEEKAKDIMANDIIEFAESIGIFAATLRTKMPLKVAELLGFTTKGWSKRAVVASVAKLTGKSSAIITTLVKGGPIVEKAAAPAIINGAKTAIPGFKIAYDLVLKTLGVGFVGTLAISNVIDFGNWNSGAYQKTMQKVIAFLSLGTLKPDQDYRTSKTLSPDIFDKIYNEYKLLGAQFINDPYKKQHMAFTRDNFLDFTDIIGAELLRADGSATTKEVNLATLPFIIFDVSKEVVEVQAEVTQAKSVPQVKVFTGVVTQGKLGSQAAFVARETDLINDMQELQRAAENNLASFIVAMPSRIIYEIKIVSSVTSKDGFTQRGTTQQIITGYFANGTPKYKTITNKFAQLKVYVLTDKGTRTNISTITLGPVDSAEFTPSASELNLAEQEIKSNISTTDISEITTIETPQNVEVQQIEAVAPIANGVSQQTSFVANSYAEALNNLIPVRFFLGQDPNGYHIQILHVGVSPNVIYNTRELTLQEVRSLISSYPDKYKKIAGQDLTLTGEKMQIQYPGTTDLTPWSYLVLSNLEGFTGNFDDIIQGNFSKSQYVWAYKSPTGEVLTFVPLELVARLDPNSSTAATNPLASSNPNKCQATTISGWFGGTTPDNAKVAQRAVIYEAWGLGSAAYYTGTAEQNNRLLAEMKRRSGC